MTTSKDKTIEVLGQERRRCTDAATAAFVLDFVADVVVGEGAGAQVVLAILHGLVGVGDHCAFKVGLILGWWRRSNIAIEAGAASRPVDPSAWMRYRCRSVLLAEC